MTLVNALQVRPAGEDDDTDRLIVPVKPFVAARVIVEVPEALPRIWAGLTGSAVMVKPAMTPDTTTVRVNAVEFTPAASWTIRVTISLHDERVQLE